MDVYDNNEKILGRANYQKTLVLIASFFHGQLKCTAKEFSGIKTLLLLRINENQRFEIDFKVTSGKAKLVAVRKQEIALLAENVFSGQLTTRLPKGFCRIRLVGENADVKLKLRRIES